MPVTTRSKSLAQALGGMSLSEEPRPNDDTAINRVFATFELLEMIITNLTAGDILFNALGVNRAWKGVIDTSSTLQTQLFFAPASHPKGTGRRKPTINPFLLSVAVGGNKVDREDKECLFDYGPRKNDGSIDWDSQLPDRGPEPKGYRLIMEFSWAKIEADEKFSRKEASWRRMVSMQPAPREVWYTRREEGLFCEAQRGRAIKSRNRTMGETFEDLLALREDPFHLRSRTIIRTSEVYGIIVAMNTNLKPINDLDEIDQARTSRWPRGDLPTTGPGRGLLKHMRMEALLDPSYSGEWRDARDEGAD